jgi:DNA-binding CsgD family transcriptional regulator
MSGAGDSSKIYGPRLEISGQPPVPIIDRCTIGRHPSNTIAIDHKKVSRWHATIVRLSDRLFRLMDFDTKNGTWLNRERISDPAVLADGDTIRIGPLDICFKGPESLPNAAHTGLETTLAESDPQPDLANADWAVTGHGIIALDKKGKIRAMTEAARQWLDSFHNMPSADKNLPAPVHHWVEQGLARLSTEADAGLGVKPLRKVQGPHRLSIHLKSDRDRRQTMLLVSHEVPLFSCETLISEFKGQFELTRREAEILYYLALGKTNPEIGTITACSHRTVEAHLRKVFPKIGVENRQAAIVFVPDYFRSKHRRQAEA